MFTDILTPAEMAFIVLIGIPAILGLTNMLKDLHLPTRFAGPVAVVLGAGMMLAYHAWGDHRAFLLGLVGVLVGLGVTGYYDLARMIGKVEVPPAQITVDDAWLNEPVDLDNGQ